MQSMNLELVGLEGLIDSECGISPSAPELEPKHRGCAAAISKHGRAWLEEDACSSGVKMARIDGFQFSNSMLAKNPTSLTSSTSLFSKGGQQQQLLSFSSLKPDAALFSSDGFQSRASHNALLPPCHPTSRYCRSSESLNVSMQCGALAGEIRGPFTPSQWVELEHQALIYKYITSNVPIPSTLLIFLRRSLNPSAFSTFSAASLGPNSFGWGSLHLGFSGNTDPEPGRCRRTDGKKWRCSRDAVAHQKYCERHMNRGRHRSRKPVESQTGHAASSTVATTEAPTSDSLLASLAPGCGASNSHTIAQKQAGRLKPNTDPPQNGRILADKTGAGDHLPQSHIVLSAEDSKSQDTLFSITKQNISFQDPARQEFALVQSNSVSNCAQTSSHLNDQESQSHPLRHFIDKWPQSRSARTSMTWLEAVETQSEKAQISISIPMASSCYPSIISSPIQERLTLSPPKLSRPFEATQMDLSIGEVHEPIQNPIAWETSMGGPLGEVLKKTNSIPRDSGTGSSELNFMGEKGNDNPNRGSSPTDVLQKTAFGSLSNSSSISSPRTEINKAHDNSIVFGSSLLYASMPSLQA